MINPRSWWCLVIVGSIFFMEINRLYAEEHRPLPKGMTPAKLEKSVNKTLSYVDKRLLSGKSAERIEQSGNNEAIALLQGSRKEREKIGELVKQGQFETAYWALKELNKSLKDATQLVRAKDRAAKEAQDNLGSARTISDAYHELATQRGVNKEESGKEAFSFFKQAEETRTKAQSAETDKDYASAITAYTSSIEQLKKAIAIARQKGGKKTPAAAQSEEVAEMQPVEKRALPKGMTPAKLEKSVNKTLSYIDKRLLSGKSAEKIEQSGNNEAIALLQGSRKERGKIGELVKQGQFETAYWALKELNKSLKDATKLVRAKDRAAKEEKDNLESARTISDAYHELATQRGVGKEESGKEAISLFKQAEETRTKAQSAEAGKDYKLAITAYNNSIEQLKKAIAIARKR
ncbi:hypothetical protein MNBD_GAMMA26-1005 [hydrothermal vent metagenome]|uniref:Uncharacterized protein n=1 Tax=hydrothermal vent metagenome TaxID=652676 RepID=A0A3B1B2N2_9ZZZZ